MIWYGTAGGACTTARGSEAARGGLRDARGGLTERLEKKQLSTNTKNFLLYPFFSFASPYILLKL